MDRVLTYKNLIYLLNLQNYALETVHHGQRGTQENSLCIASAF